MFVSVRRYKDVKNIEILRDRAEQGLVPILKKNPGFCGYHVIMDNDGNLVSITMFDSKESALASNSQASEWVAAQGTDFLPPAIDSVTGETQMLVQV